MERCKLVKPQTCFIKESMMRNFDQNVDGIGFGTVVDMFLNLEQKC